ncbi:LOW QUALITY PROTEIN: coiled-coil domain-containing protein 15 [Ctenodactylus gundi]
MPGRMAPLKKPQNTTKLPLALNPMKSKDVLAVLAERNQAVVPVGAWVEPASPNSSEIPAYIYACMIEEELKEQLIKKQEALKHFQRQVKCRVNQQIRLRKKQQLQKSYEAAEKEGSIATQSSNPEYLTPKRTSVFPSDLNAVIGSSRLPPSSQMLGDATEGGENENELFQQQAQALSQTIKLARHRLASFKTVNKKKASVLPNGRKKSSPMQEKALLRKPAFTKINTETEEFLLNEHQDFVANMNHQSFMENKEPNCEQIFSVMTDEKGSDIYLPPNQQDDSAEDEDKPFSRVHKVKFKNPLYVVMEEKEQKQEHVEDLLDIFPEAQDGMPEAQSDLIEVQSVETEAHSVEPNIQIVELEIQSAESEGKTIKTETQDIMLKTHSITLEDGNVEVEAQDFILQENAFLHRDKDFLPEDLGGLPKDDFGVSKDQNILPKCQDQIFLPRDEVFLPNDNHVYPKEQNILPKCQDQNFLPENQDFLHRGQCVLSKNQIILPCQHVLPKDQNILHKYQEQYFLPKDQKENLKQPASVLTGGKGKEMPPLAGCQDLPLRHHQASVLDKNTFLKEFSPFMTEETVREKLPQEYHQYVPPEIHGKAFAREQVYNEHQLGWGPGFQAALAIHSGVAQEEDKKERQKQFLRHRRLFMDIEREQVKEQKRQKEQKKNIEKIKKKREQQRHAEEQRILGMSSHEVPFSEGKMRDILAQLQLEEIKSAREKQQQRDKEYVRYVEALRAQIQEKMKLYNITLPPLCCCGPDFWDAHPDTCANNCIFYKNHRAYNRALHSVISSSDISEGHLALRNAIHNFASAQRRTLKIFNKNMKSANPTAWFQGQFQTSPAFRSSPGRWAYCFTSRSWSLISELSTPRS